MKQRLPSPLTLFSLSLSPPLLVSATQTSGEGPLRFMVGARGEGEGEKGEEENKDRKKVSFSSYTFLPLPPPSSLLALATEANGEGEGEREGEKRKEESKNRKKGSSPLSYLLWVEGSLTRLMSEGDLLAEVNSIHVKNRLGIHCSSCSGILSPETGYVDIKTATNEGHWLVPFAPTYHRLAFTCW